jgi:hypothetical protein
MKDKKVLKKQIVIILAIIVLVSFCSVVLNYYFCYGRSGLIGSSYNFFCDLTELFAIPSVVPAILVYSLGFSIGAMIFGNQVNPFFGVNTIFGLIFLFIFISVITILFIIFIYKR